ncbi:zinc finger CCCH-type with G patch domain-containing protein [Ambystoma mexicanum]|uniref:zinc finger CCCH-type with G patch domain-containing protein n=1 Tax=Ambystoma mexicanum TaxID=8296 RepID=UPI0037E83F17
MQIVPTWLILQYGELSWEAHISCKMDEGSLAASILVYNSQLQQVEMALGAEVDPSQQADLHQLRDDLKQLIELTESSLASMKKSIMLSTMANTMTAPAEQDDEYLAFQAAIQELTEEDISAGCNRVSSPARLAASEESSNSFQEDEDYQESFMGDEEVSGTKVKAPYYSSWGTLEYHNAMIVGAEPPEDGKPKVRVLYLYPTHKAMKPCPYFLEEKCTFEDNCRFSHGHVVSVDELRLFEEPNLSSLQEGSACLARHTDGIWYSAKITDIDGGFFTVKFDSLLLKQTVLEGDGVIPPMRSDEASSSGESEDEVNELGFAKVIESGSTESGNWAPNCSSSFAGWEAHTRGIGSKLLAQMGYEFGKGLGKNAEGRVEPVQTVVLPKGKSLDQCVEILQQRREGKLTARKARRSHGHGHRGGARRKPSRRQPSRTVFDFLNEKLDSSDPQGSNGTAAPVATKNSSEDMYHASQSTKKSLGVQVFKTLENIRQTEKDIAKIREALVRNVGRDSMVTSQLESRLCNAQRQLEHLKAQDAKLQGQQIKAETHKKMTKF